MKKILVVYGGKSLEHDISIVTALFVMEELKKNKVGFIPLYLSHNNEFFTGDKLLDKDNYELKKGFKITKFECQNGQYVLKVGFKTYEIECAILCVHGKGVEDGTIRALFDFMNIPVSTSSLLSSAIMQDKEISKLLFQNKNIPVVDSFVVHNLANISVKEGFSFPLIIKPCNLGSSIGVKKVNNMKEYENHIRKVLQYDQKVLVEKCVENLKELNVAIIGDSNNHIISDIELVNNRSEVLTFKDKYELFKAKTSGHIINPSLNKDLINKIKHYAELAFETLNGKGVIRFDFLYDNKRDLLYLNEVNSIPGSLAYYLFEKKGLTMLDIINKLRAIAYKDSLEQKSLINVYTLSSLKAITRKK